MLQKIEEIQIAQTNFLKSGKTLDTNFRIEQLKKLKLSIKKYESELIIALKDDLGKNEFEAFTNEIGLAQKEISFHIKKLKKWAKPQKVSTPLFLFPSSSYITKQPYGKILIIGPFNFPFMLTIIPLIGALSAGNVVVVKPSENTIKTAAVIEKLLQETFDEKLVAVVLGGVEISKSLLEKRWDKIFCTGSTRVGKIVMQAAAKHLTPVELELGGKNPVIIDADANLTVAAKRIVWGKFLNAGQSCVSPDYLLIHENIKDKFLPLLKQNIVQFFTENPKQSADFGRIVNRETTQRITQLIQNETIYFGGDSDDEENYISPTIVSDVQPDSALMQEEIFGPVLPVLTFKKLEDAIDFIAEREKPLAAYFFSESKKKQHFFLTHTYSGDASINEVVIHFTNFALPFGGVGYSGIGSYHGKHSFDCFSHSRSVVKTPTFFDLPLRYPPVKNWVYQFMRLIFK